MATNYFSAIRQSLFVSKLFAAVGFDGEAAFKANDENALKAYFDQAVSAAKAGNPDHQKLIEDGIAENANLAATVADSAKQIEALNAKVADAGKLAAALAEVGIAETDSAKFKVAYEANVTKAARLFLAKSGHPGLTEEIATEPTKKQAAKEMTLAEFNALKDTAAKMTFIRSGGKITNQ